MGLSILIRLSPPLQSVQRHCHLRLICLLFKATTIQCGTVCSHKAMEKNNKVFGSGPNDILASAVYTFFSLCESVRPLSKREKAERERERERERDGEKEVVKEREKIGGVSYRYSFICLCIFTERVKLNAFASPYKHDCVSL